MKSLHIDSETFKDAFVETKPSEGIDTEKKKLFLDDFYKAPSNSGDDPVVFREQAIKLCDAMGNAGMENFSSLREKFPNGLEVNPMLITMKETMESIYFMMHNHSSRTFDDLKNEYKDRSFLCGAGTNTNLQMILSNLILGKMGFDALVTSSKREWVEQVAQDMRSQKLFPQCNPPRSSMEIHDISSLVNAVADEYQLVKMTPQEDPYLKTISPESSTLFRNTLEEKLSQPETVAAILNIMTNTLMNMIPEYSEEKYPKKQKNGMPGIYYAEAVNEVLERFGLDVGSRHLIARKDMYEDGLKPQAQEIIKHALIFALVKKGLLPETASTYSKFLIHYVESDMGELNDLHLLDNSHVCDYDTWQNIVDSAHHNKLYKHLLTYKIRLSDEVREELLTYTSPKTEYFLYRYAIIHNDRELLEKAHTFKMNTGQRRALLKLAHEHNNKTEEEILWESIERKTDEQQWERIEWAITNNHLDIFKSMLPYLENQTADRDQGMAYVLLLAAREDKPVIINAILDLEYADKIPVGESGLGDALICATANNNQEASKAILSSKHANKIPGGKFGLGEALSYTASNGEIELIKIILASEHAGAIPVGEFGLGDALICATEKNCKEAINAILTSEDASKIPAGELGLGEALGYAAEKNSKEAIDAILSSEHADKIPEEQFGLGQALGHAAVTGHQETTEAILASKHASRIPLEGKYGLRMILNTAFRQKKRESVIAILSSKEAGKIPFDGTGGIGPIFRDAALNGNLEIIRAVVESEYITNIRISEMDGIAMVLQAVIGTKNKEIVEFILGSKYGKAIPIHGENSLQTALQMAAYHGEVEIFNLLLAAREKHTLEESEVPKFDFDRVLEHAAFYDHVKIVKIILALDDAASISLSQQFQILRSAATQGSMKTINACLASPHFSDITITGKFGLVTILQDAIREGSMKTAEVILATDKMKGAAAEDIYDTLNMISDVGTKNLTAKDFVLSELLTLAVKQTRLMPQEATADRGKDTSKDGLYYDAKTEELVHVKEGNIKKRLPMSTILPGKGQRSTFEERITIKESTEKKPPSTGLFSPSISTTKFPGKNL